MKKSTLLGLAAVAAAGALAAVKLLGGTEDDAAPEQEPEQRGAAPVDPDKIVAFPLKNKYTNQSGGDEPTYIFELDTPTGAKEVVVTAAHYETYYIGDEVICLETPTGLEIV